MARLSADAWTLIRRASCLFLCCALAGCVQPLTKPPGLTCRTRLPLHEPVDPTAMAGPMLLEDTIAAKRLSAGSGPIVISILALSGGGKYGAFGAGFLAGWSDAEQKGQIVPIRREEIDIVTGVSTGALLSTFAAVGNLSAEHGGSAALRAKADQDAHAAYQVSDKDLFRRKPIIAALSSNGLIDPRGLLTARVKNSVSAYRSTIAALPEGHKILIGAVNRTNGKFYVADMREVARIGPEAEDCYTEWLLASAAVPGSFPPRFIDGHAYVDGGVRFGAFLGNDVRRIVRRTRDPGDTLLGNADVRINLIALFNNPLTANNPARDAQAALACDRSTLETAAALCPAPKNRVLDIVMQVAGDIMPHQLYLDSVYRLQRELEAAGVLGISKFIYAAPERIAAKQCRAATDDQFDRTYMDCLYALGFETAHDVRLWQNFDEVPRVIRAPERR